MTRVAEHCSPNFLTSSLYAYNGQTRVPPRARNAGLIVGNGERPSGPAFLPHQKRLPGADWHGAGTYGSTIDHLK